LERRRAWIKLRSCIYLKPQGLFNIVLNSRQFRCAGIAFALCAIVAGCGGEESSAVPATQVAAKVNSDEITVHQINAVLARTPNVPPEAADRAKREILERLVEQRVAVQQAILRKLDRSPTVQPALEAARSEILARAYFEHIGSTQPKPSDEDAKKYYADHPALFAQRRVFVVEEVVLEADEAVARELRQRAASSRSLKDIALWLQSQGVRFASNGGVRAAEQIPLEVLPKLHAAGDGAIVIHETGRNRQLIRVVTSKSEPVDEGTALPRILQFLANSRTREAIAAEMKQLMAGANIAYVGEFAPDAAEAAKAKAEASAKARAAAEAEAKARADAEARSAEATKLRLEAETRARLEAEARERAAQKEQRPLPADAIRKGVGVN